MKSTIIKYFFIPLLWIGCTADDVNDDPNTTYNTVPETLVTYAQKELSDYVNTPNVNENNFRLTMQYWQESIYVNESNYNFTSRNVSNNVWTDTYVNVLNNLNKAKTLIEEYQPKATEVNSWPTKKKNQLAIIDLLSVYTFQLLVDTYGNIPYSQSLNNDQYPLPVYDDAAGIYADLILRTKTALGNIQNGGTFGNGDIIYNGDLTLWKKFGNSLLLKLGISLSDVNASLAQSTINEAISGGVITDGSESCVFRYLADSPNFSPVYENMDRDDFFAGKPVIDFMNSSNDARISKYFQDVNGVYIGQVIGQGGDFADFSAPGEFAYDPTTPGNLITYTEVAFYLAEAAARFGIGGNAETLYNEAITASFLEWGLTSADAQNYLTNYPYDSTNWKKSIGEQAWIAMYNQPLVSWNFYRRLDYPLLQAPPTAIANAEGKVPVRMQYPTLEATTNGTNYSNAASAIGGDRLTTKIFWDIQ